MPRLKNSKRLKQATFLASIAAIALGCSWVGWPDVTARRFMTRCATSADADESLLKVRSPTHDLVGFQEMLRAEHGDVNVTFQTRTFADLIVGRRSCAVDWPRGRYRFSVARGAVVSGPTLSLVYGRQEVMLDVF